MKVQMIPENKVSEENIPKNKVFESFAPQKKEYVKGMDFFNTISEDVSWFFEKKKTKHKLAVVPVYSYNQTSGVRLGLRLFGYSSDKTGYYLALAGSRYLSFPSYRINISYIGSR